jgi:hypothetical protein
MLFTPPLPLSAQSVSSTEKDETPLSSPPTPSVSDFSSIETRPRAVSTLHNAKFINNGPPNNRLLSTSPSHLPDQDWFYSPSPSSPSRPSVHYLKPTGSIISKTKSSNTNRRVSCPATHNTAKKDTRFRFTNTIASTIRDVLMTNKHLTNPSIYANDIPQNSKTSSSECARLSTTFLPVANPVAAAALVEDDEIINKSITPPLFDPPQSNARCHRTPTECSSNTIPPHNSNSKAILNVGGVRHEGNFPNYIIFFFVYN